MDAHGAGEFQSCTKLGNMKRDDMAQHLGDVFEMLRSVDTEELQKSLDGCIAGRLRLDEEIKRWKVVVKLHKYGDFKIYFTCKILAKKFTCIQYDLAVGPNVSGRGRIKKDNCAYYQLFGGLPSELSEKLEHALLSYVLMRARPLAIGKRNLESLVSLDVIEHSLCEWVKARRNKAKCSARSLVRRDACPRGASVGLSSRRGS